MIIIHFKKLPKIHIFRDIIDYFVAFFDCLRYVFSCFKQKKCHYKTRGAQLSASCINNIN